MRVANITKTVISKFVRASSSRYNPLKKKDVVEEIYRILKGTQWDLLWKKDADLAGKTWRDVESLNGDERVEVLVTNRHYHFGTYCPNSIMSGEDYYVSATKRHVLRGRHKDDGSFAEKDRLQFVGGSNQTKGWFDAIRGSRGRK